MIWWNAIAAVLVVAASMWVAVAPLGASSRSVALRREVAASADIVVRGGAPGLLDATGHFVPIRHYQRIVSGSSVSDGMLLELCEPARILRVTNYSADDSPFRHRFAGKGMQNPLQDLEGLIALKPDLVLLHHIGSIEHVARLREAGLAVFVFGEMRGLATLLPNLRALGALVGRAARAAELAARFERRMRGVALNVPKERRPGGLYVSIHGDKIYGGTDGTSYHDVLTAAGVRDVAADHYDDWPVYTSEELLSLDPEVVVTSTGMQQLFCGHPGFDRLRACRNGRVVEVDGVLVSSPGLDMLEAAEAVFEAVHGKDVVCEDN